MIKFMLDGGILEISIRRPRLSRREMLFSVWIGSLIVALIMFVVAGLWYVHPRVPYVAIGRIEDYPPRWEPYRVMLDQERHAWVVNTGIDLIVFDERTPHVWGCRYKWVPSNQRFEDPCTGARFTLQGEHLYGPGMRGLDRYAYRIAGEQIQVETWRIVDEPPRTNDPSVFRRKKHVDVKSGLNVE